MVLIGRNVWQLFIIVIVLQREPTKDYPRRVWAWLKDKNNRGRVIAIAAVATAIFALVGLFINNGTGPASPPRGGEVRLSVTDFQAVLERREQETRKELARTHGDERNRLENELEPSVFR